MAAKDLEKLNISAGDPGILPPPPGQAAGFSFASTAAKGAQQGFAFNMPPAPPAPDDDDDDDELKLPAAVLGRVLGLRALQQKRDAVMVEYVKERADLDRKYRDQVAPILEDRSRIVRGTLEPHLTQEDRQTVEKAGASDGESVKGVPDFWLSACGRHDAFGGTIEEADVQALKCLVDVRCIDNDDLDGFRIEFEFEENPFFFDTVLTKAYKVPNLVDSNGQPELEKIEGCEVHWKPGKDLTQRQVKKKQKSKRGKNAGATRVVTKVEAKPSFFRFFESIPLPGDDDEALGEDAVEELRDKIDADVELAFALRNEVVPKAILWFTGEAVDDDDDDDFDDQDFDSEDA